MEELVIGRDAKLQLTSTRAWMLRGFPGTSTLKQLHDQ